MRNLFRMGMLGLLPFSLLVSACGGRERGVEVEGSGLLAPPVMLLSDSLLSYGRMRAQETLERSVRIANAGGGLLRVQVAQPGCRCLAVRPMELSIAAGKSAVLRVALSGRGLAGSELKWIDLTSNGTPGRARLYVLAQVDGDVQFELMND